MANSPNKIFHSNSTEETLEAACKLGSELSGHSIVCLTGQLGSGKTVFAKGLAQQWQIEEEICSPTFPILFEYQGARKGPLYHFDLYRLGSYEEFYHIGGDDILAGQGNLGPGLVILEWPDVILDELPRPFWQVSLEVDASSLQRKISISKVLDE